ncbi:MAG: hypothetical protein ABI304_11540 [Rudaea sp.]
MDAGKNSYAEWANSVPCSLVAVPCMAIEAVRHEFHLVMQVIYFYEIGLLICASD